MKLKEAIKEIKNNARIAAIEIQTGTYDFKEEKKGAAVGIAASISPFMTKVSYAASLSGSNYSGDNSGIFKTMEGSIMTILKNLIIFSSILLAAGLVIVLIVDFMLPGGDSKKGWNNIKRLVGAYLALNGLGAIIAFIRSILPSSAGL